MLISHWRFEKQEFTLSLNKEKVFTITSDKTIGEKIPEGHSKDIRSFDISVKETTLTQNNNS